MDVKSNNETAFIKWLMVRSLVGILLLFGVLTCKAQPFTMDEKIKPTELKLSNYPGTSPIEKGRIVVASVNQKDEAIYFYVKGISIFSPIVVSVDSLQKESKIDISFHKDFWTEIEQSGATQANGRFVSLFKTGGDFGIKIMSRKIPVKYQIMIWVGEEIIDDLPSPFKKQKPTR